MRTIAKTEESITVLMNNKEARTPKTCLKKLGIDPQTDKIKQVMPNVFRVTFA